MKCLPPVRVGLGFNLWGASGSGGAYAPGASVFGPSPTTFNPGTVACPPGSTIEPNNTCTDNSTGAVVTPTGTYNADGTIKPWPAPAPTGVPSNGGLYGGGGTSTTTTNPYVPNTNLPGRGSSTGGGVTAVGPAPFVPPGSTTVPNPIPGLPPIIVSTAASPAPGQTAPYANPASAAAAVRGMTTPKTFPVVPVAIGVAALGAIAVLLAGVRP